MNKIKTILAKIGMKFKELFNNLVIFYRSHKKGCNIALVVLLVIGFMFGADYARKSKETEELRQKYELYKIPSYEKIDIDGKVTPRESKQYAYPENNSLSDISIENGQEVNDGDLLFTTKDSSVVDQINTLKSQLSTLNSQKSSAGKNANGVAVDTSAITAQISSVESQISSLNERAYIKNTAPFKGKVYINDQNSTDMSKSFISLVSSDFYMKGYISEDDLRKAQIDQTVALTIDSTSQKMTGRISYVSDRPTEDRAKGMKDGVSYYDVHVSFENQEGLINGYHVGAVLEVISNEYKVPTSAIIKNDGEAYVMKNLDGILKKQLVTIVKEGKEQTVINAALEPGDQIIKRPDKTMKEGDSIPTEGLVDKSPKLDPEDLKIPNVDGIIEEDK